MKKAPLFHNSTQIGMLERHRLDDGDMRIYAVAMLGRGIVYYTEDMRIVATEDIWYRRQRDPFGSTEQAASLEFDCPIYSETRKRAFRAATGSPQKAYDDGHKFSSITWHITWSLVWPRGCQPFFRRSSTSKRYTYNRDTKRLFVISCEKRNKRSIRDVTYYAHSRFCSRMGMTPEEVQSKGQQDLCDLLTYYVGSGVADPDVSAGLARRVCRARAKQPDISLRKALGLSAKLFAEAIGGAFNVLAAAAKGWSAQEIRLAQRNGGIIAALTTISYYDIKRVSGAKPEQAARLAVQYRTSQWLLADTLTMAIKYKVRIPIQDLAPAGIEYQHRYLTNVGRTHSRK